MCLKCKPKNVTKTFIVTLIEIIGENKDIELVEYMCQTLV